MKTVKDIILTPLQFSSNLISFFHQCLYDYNFRCILRILANWSAEGIMRQQCRSSSPPRPSSVSSSQSLQSNSSTKYVRRKTRWRSDANDICVGEDLKIAVTTAIERFRLSEDQLGKFKTFTTLYLKHCNDYDNVCGI